MSPDPSNVPRGMLVRAALASKKARIVWSLMVKNKVYRAPAAARKPTDSREDVGAEEGKELYGATVVRRDWENQCATECL